MKLLRLTKGTLILFALCLPLLVTSCGGDDAIDSEVARITIRNKSELANTPIDVRRELILDADVENKEGVNVSLGGDFLSGNVSPVSMRWSSSNTSVATIKQGGKFGNSGVLKAIAPGMTVIRVEASGVSDSVEITVK